MTAEPRRPDTVRKIADDVREACHRILPQSPTIAHWLALRAALAFNDALTLAAIDECRTRTKITPEEREAIEECEQVLDQIRAETYANARKEIQTKFAAKLEEVRREARGRGEVE